MNVMCLNSKSCRIFKSISHCRQQFRRIISRNISENNFIYGSHVLEAKNNGMPIVALESTIITHGMPYPQNLETALQVESAVRENGAIPATIAILDGKVHIGVNKKEIEQLSKTQREKVIKCSRRDLSYVISQKLNGSTTVCGTMLLANLAGIEIMATGGIGGVHRGAELNFDVSADLTELGRTPVTVVCAGVKAILDIPKTLEYLETKGVPVITIGESNNFPAFYSRETFDKIKAPMKLSNAMEAASLIRTQRALNINSGLLFAVPIPESHALDPNEIEINIQKALLKANENNITGKEITPFLLQELAELTVGQSVQSNIALITNNAKVAAEIARNLNSKTENDVEETSGSKGRPVVIGGAVFDTILQVKELQITFNGSTHKGKSREACGGVGRNVASALVHLGLFNTKLISVIGNDEAGKAIIKSLKEAGDSLQILSNKSTARYSAILDNKGECCFGIGEMDAFSEINVPLVKKNYSVLEKADLIVLDGNPPIETMSAILDIAKTLRKPVWYEPTDFQKAIKIFQAGSQWEKTLHFISPNRNELLAIAKYFGIPIPNDEFKTYEAVKHVAENLAKIVPVVITTLGSLGVMVSRKAAGNRAFYDERGELIYDEDIQSRLYKPHLQLDNIPEVHQSSVSGCGDCLAAGIIVGILNKFSEAECISLGLKAAAISLRSFEAVPQQLSTLQIEEK
ncbi:pseudouridine-metabolizing bifunctional protein C1861.05 [Leptopilina heterotoma]|uniref:pseudouridine-metabolizing bifunctional protein C1861.05 n=1 Tax=Leptopilina heterotoma TaxID=63436 RepID=UPI001CAA14BD|nr:pseudouridine-metabolizing bifunctional protein C1861.05 [Leptopilina heterotoma]XP_043476486.1 pseudouridine-metabolizing bifunctional protein C1861.05 [Leptopilina heterotoma]XP_043476487.1 pseudouridine-metabolizing bifunctional protein C1861.05 [Leptopilina heterotoma]